MENYSKETIIGFINSILNRQNTRTTRKAEYEFQRLTLHKNFTREFYQFALCEQMTERQKIITLLNINRFYERHPDYNILLDEMQLILSLLNNNEVPQKYKEVLTNMLIKNYCFNRKRYEVRTLILHRLSKKEIEEDDFYLLYISQFILAKNEDFYAQIDYITQIGPLFFKMALHTLSLLHWYQKPYFFCLALRVMKIIVVKLDKAADEMIVQFLNGQVCGFIEDCFSVRYPQEDEMKIKIQIFEIIQWLITHTVYCLSKNSRVIKFTELLSKVFSETILLLQKLYALPNPSEQGVAICLKVLTKIYNNSSLLSQIQRVEDMELIRCLLKALKINKIHYENYAQNPFEFINLIHNFLREEKKGIVSSYAPLQEQHYKQQNHHTNLIRQVCIKQQEFCFNLLTLIIEVLNRESEIQELSRASCLIILGILKNEVVKRSQLLQSAKECLLKILFHRESIDYSNVQFTICAIICNEYSKQFFQDRQIQSQLFQFLCKTLQSNDIDLTMKLFAIEMLAQFIHREEYCPSILDFGRQAIQEDKQHPLLTNQHIKMYTAFLTNIALLNIPSIEQIYYKGINTIAKKVKKWNNEPKIHYLVCNTICLLLQYKEKVQFSNGTYVHTIRESDLIKLLVQLRQLCSKEKTLLNFFDRQFISSFNNTLEECKSSEDLESMKDYSFFLTVLNINVMNKQTNFCQFYKEFLQGMIKHYKLINKQFMQTVVRMLVLLIKIEDSDISLGNLMLMEDYILLVGQMMTEQQRYSIYKLFLRVKHDSYIKVQSCVIVLKMAFFLLNCSKNICESDFLKQLRFSQEIFTNNVRVNQRSIYLLSKIIERLAKEGKMSQMQQTTKAIFPLLDCNIDESYRMERDAKDRFMMKEPAINEWSQFRRLVDFLKKHNYWDNLKLCLSVDQLHTLSRGLSCQNFENSARVIYKLKM